MNKGIFSLDYCLETSLFSIINQCSVVGASEWQQIGHIHLSPDSVHIAAVRGIRGDVTSVSVSLGFMGITSRNTEQEVT